MIYIKNDWNYDFTWLALTKNDFIDQGIEFKSIDRSSWDLEEWKSDANLPNFDQCHTIVHIGLQL